MKRTAPRQNVVVLGAGLIAKPLVRYLLSRTQAHVCVADDDVARAQAQIGASTRGFARRIDATDERALGELLGEAELVISLLPAPLHPLVARLAVARRVPMITTSYVSPALRALDPAARAAGVALLNEVGLDPGIDHMSAMAVFAQIERAGATVTHFSSCCGGLPARAANDNPWGYKFSWNPRGVLAATRNPARYRAFGRTVSIDRDELLKHPFQVAVDRVGTLEVYANRDALPYAELYGIGAAEGVFRGTYRWPGWCETLSAAARLGLLDDTELHWPAGSTWARLTTRQVPGSGGTARTRLTSFLRRGADDALIERLDWAGLLADEPLPRARAAPLDLLTERLAQRLRYAPGQRDLVVLRHDFRARRRDGSIEHRQASLVSYGKPHADTAMSRTVALPAAIAARLILERKFRGTGVLIPVLPELYLPILDELEELGIRLRESCSVERPAKRGRKEGAA